MIEALASKCPNDPFAVGVLPRLRASRHDLLQAKTSHPSLELFPVDSVAVPEQEPDVRLPRKRLHDLLGRRWWRPPASANATTTPPRSVRTFGQTLRSLPIVVFEHAAEPLVARNSAERIRNISALPEVPIGVR